MDTPLIRKARVEDFIAVQKLCDELIHFSSNYDPNYNLKWSFEENGIKYIKSRISGKKRVCFVADAGGALVGYITGSMLTIEPWRPFLRAEVENLYVIETFRHKGVGKRLMKKFKEWSKAKGATRIIVSTMSNDQNDAVNFYKRNMFNPLHIILESHL